jgi:hypothetical protein
MTPRARALSAIGAVALLAAWPHSHAAAQAPAAARPARDRTLEALVFDVAGGPAEFSADLLIRLAGSTVVADPDWKRELLETAFGRAYGVHESHKRAAPNASVDSRAGGFTRAYATGLDALTLQLRAVLGMIPVDPARARELFEWIDFYLPPASCSDVLIPVADEYYSTLTTMARRTFPAGADGRDRALRFLETNLWRARLPSEMPAVVRAVRAFQPRRDEAGYLEVSISALMERRERDARGFSAFGLDITTKTGELADLDRNAGVGGETLMRALRRYLVGELSGSRCSDSVAERPIVDAFNDLVRRKEVPADIATPIAAHEVRPARVLGAAPADRYWATPDARRLVDGLVGLREPLQKRGAAVTAIKQSPAWQTQAQQWLLDLELWNGTHEPVARDYFDEKSLMFGGFLDLAPPAALRTRALRSFVEFLRRSDKDRDRRALWFAHVRLLLDRNDPNILTAFDESGDFVLSLYARAQRVLYQPRR